MNNLTIKNFVARQNKSKNLFTAGPASLLEENLLGLRPCFGRGDTDYLKIENYVLNKLKSMSKHKYIVRMQGSGSLALEIVASNFFYGNILIIDTGYYSDRLYLLASNAKKNFNKIKKVDKISWKSFDKIINKKYDWIWACPTETSVGLKLPISKLKKISKKFKSKLALDATASFGLEDGHELADVISYSSCKGLFGLTGASFVAFNNKPKHNISSFYLNIFNHLNKKMTGPYHSICSLYEVLKKHNKIKKSVIKNKKIFIKKMKKWITFDDENQPLLCTYINKKIKKIKNNVILYEPRNKLQGSVVCHLGEVHLRDKSNGNILDFIKI
jgi:2-aminoethylphosphonate-pyruvate transaminase